MFDFAFRRDNCKKVFHYNIGYVELWEVCVCLIVAEIRARRLIGDPL